MINQNSILSSEIVCVEDVSTIIKNGYRSEFIIKIAKTPGIVLHTFNFDAQERVRRIINKKIIKIEKIIDKELKKIDKELGIH